jgi:hypothetical protein
MPHPDSPIQDPYLGRQSLYLFDVLIPPAMALNQKVAAWTHGVPLTRLQRAACQVIPNGFSLALAIRELIRTGYLFSAEILLRPLMERAAVISHLMRCGEEALDLWEKGWPHKTRPSLSLMLDSINDYSDFEQGGEVNKFVDYAKETVKHFNSIIHADPVGLDTNIGLTPSGVVGYLSAANLNNPKLCDRICHHSVIYLTLLMKRSAEILPNIKAAHDATNGGNNSLESS